MIAMQRTVYHDALDLQHTDSVSGVIFGLSDIISRIQNDRTANRLAHLQQEELRQHPAVVAVVHKLESMVGSMLDHRYEAAIAECNRAVSQGLDTTGEL